MSHRQWCNTINWCGVIAQYIVWQWCVPGTLPRALSQKLFSVEILAGLSGVWVIKQDGHLLSGVLETSQNSMRPRLPYGAHRSVLPTLNYSFQIWLTLTTRFVFPFKLPICFASFCLFYPYISESKQTLHFPFLPQQEENLRGRWLGERRGSMRSVWIATQVISDRRRLKSKSYQDRWDTVTISKAKTRPDSYSIAS